MATYTGLKVFLRSVKAVLFDFDGPLCDVFAGLPAPHVARRLELIAGKAYETDDPLEVLVGSSRTDDPTVVGRVEQELVKAELDAIDVSRAIDEGLEAVRACAVAGLKVGVVSNNSPEAVRSFLTKHDLVGKMSVVVGRPFGRPDLMKPNPWPLVQAIEEMRLSSDDVVFVGDSDTDIEASRAAGVRCVAYANKPGKRERFAATSAVVIGSMRDVGQAVV